MGGKKYDQGKPMMDLVRPEFTEGVASVLTFGAQKYDAWNWTKGIKYSRLIAAAERHMNAFKKGEDLDPESGLNHLYHAACCLMFLSCFSEWDKDYLDDRFNASRDSIVPRECDVHLAQSISTAERSTPQDMVGPAAVDGDGRMRNFLNTPDSAN